MTTLELYLPGEPHAQARGRAGVVRGKGGKPILVNGEPIIRVHDPKKSRDWKATAQQHMRDAWPGTPLQGPVDLDLVAVFTRPVSSYRKREPMPREWHTKKPDADNVIKAVKDAGKGVLWLDDSQVALERCRKLIAAQGEAPFVWLRVRPLAAAELLEVEAIAIARPRPVAALAAATTGALFAAIPGGGA